MNTTDYQKYRLIRPLVQAPKKDKKQTAEKWFKEVQTKIRRKHPEMSLAATLGWILDEYANKEEK